MARPYCPDAHTVRHLALPTSPLLSSRVRDSPSTSSAPEKHPVQSEPRHPSAAQWLPAAGLHTAGGSLDDKRGRARTPEASFQQPVRLVSPGRCRSRACAWSPPMHGAGMGETPGRPGVDADLPL